ncbi:MAG TPA: hypothetical protein ENJ13_04405 [Chromatiales bacterium]|nr:hypothetical protein [Chromatiales bacterium]
MKDVDDLSMFAPSGPPPIPEEFEKLRHMEAFSEAMFNRIISIQEKDHPAWDTTKPFVDRIKNIPLHALIFSNPDRDPAEFAATIAPFYPLRGEMQQIAHCIKQVAEAPIVCDLHAGNGFVGSLLAHEGVKVVGTRDPAAKPNQITDFYDAERYTMKEMAVDAIDFKFDVAFSAWMPGGKNLTPEILKHKPKLIVFIHTDHTDEKNEVPQTGTPEAFTALPENYALIAGWSITRPQDCLKEVWEELTPSIEEVRHVKIYADTPWHEIDLGEGLVPEEPYDWEKELDMVLTGLSAKEHLRSQGFPV